MRENRFERGPLPVQRLRDVAAILALGVLRYCRLARKSGVPDGSFAWSADAETVVNSTDFAESIVGNSGGFSPN